MKINYLKSLQDMARKEKAGFIISYSELVPLKGEPTYLWNSTFAVGCEISEAHDKSFSQMVKKLYREVKKV